MQTLPPSDNENNEAQIKEIAGFSLHAGKMARRDQRRKLEILCRYICCAAVSEKRLAMTHSGRIRYQLKTPYRDGTTDVFFQPLDFIVRLAEPLIRARQLFHMPDSPEFKLPTCMVYSLNSDSIVLEQVLDSLRADHH